MKKITYLILAIAIIACKQETSVTPPQLAEVVLKNVPKINLEEANRLAELPLNCVGVEYPNKLGQTIGGPQDLQSPKALHPTFYGCFDWHSAVHGHWSLVSLLRQFPELEKKEEAQEWLLASISKENIAKEVAYFDGKHNKSYERTYGWAWVLKLAEELKKWDAPIARELESNLQPLTDLMVSKYLDFLPKLNYPIRVGEHPNTAFGMSFAYDYAEEAKHTQLQTAISERARDFYMNDAGCPLTWEPSGFDFLSPCLEEAALMKRVLAKEEFDRWITAFLPQLKDPNFTMPVGEVSDRSDGKLVHLDGVNFSRAWSLNYIAHELPEFSHLNQVAIDHINNSLPNIVGDSYEGGHWLGSFAIYALNSLE
jgi:hypothetical protein